MIKVKLNIPERNALPKLFAKTGDFITLSMFKLVDDARALKDHEIKEWKEKGVLAENGFPGENWEKFDKGIREISVPDDFIKYAKNELIKMDNEKRLELDLISLYEKFVQKHVDNPDELEPKKNPKKKK